MRLSQNPVQLFPLLDNPEDLENINNLNHYLIQYNTVKTRLNQRLGDDAATDPQIRVAFTQARNHLDNIWNQCQNNQGIQVIIGVQFNRERDFIIQVAAGRNYGAVNIVAMDVPPEPIERPIPLPPPPPDFLTKALPWVRVFSLLVGVASFGWGLGIVTVTTQVYKESFKQAVKKAAFPLAISALSFVIFGVNEICLRRRPKGTIPDFNPELGGLQ
jgi:hypothetical protein